MVESGGEMERGNRPRLQHHKKQGCFGIKILAIRCQIELPETKGPIWCSKNHRKRRSMEGCIFVAAVFWTVVFLSQLYLESCIFVSAVFRKLYFGLSCILKVVFCNISSVVLRLA